MRELLGRVDVELLARKLENLRAQGLKLGTRFNRDGGQGLNIDGGADALHAGKHANQGRVDGMVNPVGTMGFKLTGQLARQGLDDGGIAGKGNGGVLAGIEGQHAELLLRQIGEGKLPCIGVAHVVGQGHVEEAGAHHFSRVQKRRLGRVAGEGSFDGLLGIMAVEGGATNDIGDGNGRIVPREQGRARIFGKMHRERQARLEQGRLPRFGPSKRKLDPLGKQGIERRARLIIAQKGLPLRQINLDGRSGPCPGEAQHLAQVRHHSILAESLGHLRRVEAGPGNLLDVELEIGIAHDGGNLARKEGRIFVVGKILELLALQIAQVVVNALNTAVLRQKFGGGFGADARHAGDVIGRIAHKAKEIRELRRSDAVALIHLLRAVNGDVGDAALSGYDAREVAGKLVGVLVAGYQKARVAELLAAGRNRAQNIVALPAGKRHHGDAHGLKKLLDHRKLGLQIGIHGRARGLVLLQCLGTKRRAPLVEGAHDGVRIRDLDELYKHGKEAENRVGRGSVRRDHGRRDGVKSAMHQGVSVDDGDLLGHIRLPLVFKSAEIIPRQGQQPLQKHALPKPRKRRRSRQRPEKRRSSRPHAVRNPSARPNEQAALPLNGRRLLAAISLGLRRKGPAAQTARNARANLAHVLS